MKADPLEINYIILAHKNPEQLRRLIDRLTEPWTRFYVHIDQQTPILPFKRNLQDKKNVYFLERENRERGIWGDLGIVKATLNAIEQILQDNRSGYCILISGQDYPLRKNKDLRNFLQTHSNTAFITLFPLPHSSLSRGGLPRINRYKINKSNQRGHFTLLPSIFDKEFYTIETAGKINYLRKSGKWVQILKIFRKRKFPSYITPYGGSVYWALPIKTTKNIIEFVDKHPDYLRYHEFTQCADEIFFHSIVMFLKQRDNFELTPSLTYANWERKSGPLPVTFTTSDLEELIQASNNNFFARKFDINKDKNVLDLIENLFLK